MSMRPRKSICVGLDVHKNNVWACVAFKNPDVKYDELKFVTKKFNSNHTDLVDMCDWARSVVPKQLVQSPEDLAIHVYMESTGKYSSPVYDVCEEMGMIPHIVNPKHVRMIEGQKKDQKDCAWIAELGSNGLLRESYIPQRPIREARGLSRTRTKLVQERGNVFRRIRNILTEANCRVDLVFSGIEGESAMRVIMYMIETEEPDFYEVLKLIRKSCKIMKYSSEEERKEKEEELRKAIVGAKFSPQQKFKLRSAYEKIDQLNKQIRNYEYMMHQTLEPFNNYLDLLDSIPGISKLAAMQILAEIGTDMDHFENEKQFISWCGLCPQSNESNNKHKTVKIGKGGYYLKPVLIQCALAAVKSHYFKVKYESISRRRGKKRALIAIARKLMVIAYHLFQTGEYFREDYGQEKLENSWSEENKTSEETEETPISSDARQTAQELADILADADLDKLKPKIEQLLIQMGITQAIQKATKLNAS